jgi:hypothetical protein
MGDSLAGMMMLGGALFGVIGFAVVVLAFLLGATFGASMRSEEIRRGEIPRPRAVPLLEVVGTSEAWDELR